MLTIDWRPSARQLRNFGLVTSVFAAAVGVWVFLTGSFVGLALSEPTGRLLTYGLWSLSAVCLAMALVAPKGLRPLYVVLNAIALPIGLVVSFFILSGLYYLLLTPVSLVFRLLGRDALRRQFDPQADSYWVPRETPKDKRSYFRQF
jgi:hypothetical protein